MPKLDPVDNFTPEEKVTLAEWEFEPYGKSNALYMRDDCNADPATLYVLYKSDGKIKLGIYREESQRDKASLDEAGKAMIADMQRVVL